MAGIVYSIKKNRLEKSYISGFIRDEETNRLYLDPGTGIHRLYTDCIDSAQDGCEWGRFSFAASLTENMAMYVYAFASDVNNWYDNEGRDFLLADVLRSEDIPDEEKKRLFNNEKALRYVGRNDVLLYRLKGRYLYLAIEILGSGEGYIDRLKVDMKGDYFMDAFPSVYRERDSFFHRFLSVFSSIHSDIEHEIENLPRLLDPETCPRECLGIYAGWLGIDLSGDFLTEEAERLFVKEAYSLNRMKGTKQCLKRVIEIVLGESAIILENNTIQSYMTPQEMKENGLRNGGIYDVNILIRKSLSDTDRRQLGFLLDQFKPVRSRLHLIPLRDTDALDGETYLDMNAVIAGERIGVMDDDMELGDGVILDE